MFKFWEKLTLSWLMRSAYGCFSLGFIFLSVGFFTTYWNDYSYSDMTSNKKVYHLGLWQNCYAYGADVKCQQYTVKGGIVAARAFETLAFLSFIAITAVFIYHCRKGQTKLLFIASVGCTITAGLIIIGAMSWVTSATYLQYNLSWSFALCILGAVLCGVTSVLLLQERLNVLATKQRKISTAEAMISSTDALDLS